MPVKLSVCIITYNHEKYLAQALDSALAQKTDFDVEIVVGEDCSTDGTRKILLDYAARYPDRIRPLLPERNQGINRNLAATLRACRGRYVALLEGDDYWVDPRKLQKQVDFLDAHPDYQLVFHDIYTIKEGEPQSERPYRAPVGGKRDLGLEDLIEIGNFVPTCSAVFRNRDFGTLPDWLFTLRIGDFPLNLLTAALGKLRHMPEAMATYRIHSGGTFSGQRTAGNVGEVVRLYDLVNQHFSYRYDRQIRAIQSYWRAVECFRQGDVAQGRTWARRSLLSRPLSVRGAKAAIMYLAPWAYQRLRRADWSASS